jgi:hypothetical protein
MAALLLALIAVLARPAFSAPTQYPTNDSYPHPANGHCTDYTIEEQVTWTKSIWGLAKPETNFDIAAIRTGLGALDVDFKPISGTESSTDTYRLSGTFCTPLQKKGGKEKTVLLATHGGGYDRRLVESPICLDHDADIALATGPRHSNQMNTTLSSMR